MLGLKCARYSDKLGLHSRWTIEAMPSLVLRCTDPDEANRVTREHFQWAMEAACWDGTFLAASCSPHQLWKDTPWVKHDAANVPNESCSCGIHGVYSIESIVHYLDEFIPRIRYDADVILLVNAFGKVIPARMGFRAQYVRAIAAVTHKGLGQRGQLISGMFGLPVISSQEAMREIGKETQCQS